MKKETPLSRNRRGFLRQAIIGTAIAPMLWAQEKKRFRAAVFGHTAAGNYGHELDVAFKDIADVEIVAVADPVESGAKKAAERAGAKKTYSDFQNLLKEEKPDIAVIAPRWSAEHFAMGKAALEAGAHLLMEKPFTVDLKEADELLAIARQKNLKIAVAHQMRLHPATVALKNEIGEGLIGELLQIEAHGKQDSRAGGEDLMVLGTHLFDLMRMFAGEALSCLSTVTFKGKPISVRDGRAVGEKIGLVAGDEIEAEFGFAKGVRGHFTSKAKLKTTLGHWGMTLRGTKGTVRLLADVEPAIFVLHEGKWGAEEKVDVWKAYELGKLPEATGQAAFHRANKRVAQDFLAAIRRGIEPQCNGENAAKAVEMVMAVYQSALRGEKVTLPLQARKHPFVA